MIQQIIAAFVASLCFSIVFNIQGKNVIFSAIGGALSWASYIALKSLNVNLTLTFFLSAVIFSVYSEICARKLKTPVTTILVCALIPLVPGSGMYYTMYEVINDNLNEALYRGLGTLSCAGCLALGVLFVSTLSRLIKYPKQKTSNK